jgi:hypothetical protein
MRWVTKKQASSLFIGAHIRDAKEGIARSAAGSANTGRDNSKRAENFTCRMPSGM